jgi:hypothetical protein
MEVTQSIQTLPQQGLASSVPLTAHKPTTIRAYIEGTRLMHVGFSHFPDFTPISVDGTLTIKQGGSTIATLAATNGPISVTPWVSANPASANSSLNFDWAFPPSGTVSLELDITTSPASITATDPPAQAATFVHNQRLRIEGVRLQFDHDNNPGTPPTKTPDPALVANGLDWFRKRFRPVLFSLRHPRWPSGRFAPGSPIDLAIDRRGAWHVLYPGGVLAILHPDSAVAEILDPEDGVPPTALRLLAHPKTGEVFVGSDGEGVAIVGPAKGAVRDGDPEGATRP